MRAASSYLHTATEVDGPSAQVKLLTQGLVKREEALERMGEESREAAEDAERSAAAFSALAAREVGIHIQ